MKNFYAVGDNVDVVESALIHPTHTDGLVESGDHVVVGTLVGVANFTAAATTDLVVISTRGVFTVPAVAIDNSGSSGADANSAIAVGDKLYIDKTSAEISKRNNDQPFGIALEAVTAGATKTIKVKLTGF